MHTHTHPTPSYAKVARTVTTMLGLDGSNSWIPRALFEHAARDIFTCTLDLDDHLSPAERGVVSDALLALNKGALRRAGVVMGADGIVVATHHAWLDPQAGEGAHLFAASPIMMALVLDRDTGRVLLFIDATQWAATGRDIAQAYRTGLLEGMAGEDMGLARPA